MNYREEVEKIIKDLVVDCYWEHMKCSKECGKRTMEEENFKEHLDQLLSLHDQSLTELREELIEKKHTMARIEGAKRVEQDYVFLEDILSLLDTKLKEENNG
ncbi:MAG: hypothetical protein AABY22_23740 [Nanoarchaeota archaeon]